jgi:thioredoxin-dependent adenylylsulfate APS reductase
MERQVLLDKQEAMELVRKCDGQQPQEVLRRVLERFHPRIALCTSFQADGMAILDMAWRINPEVRVFTIDTGRLPQETYELIDRVREHYDLQIEVYFPDAQKVEDMVYNHGMNLFYREVDLRLQCCEIRKVFPLHRVLSTLDAWITGLRKDQGSTRSHVRQIEIDHDHGDIIKVNPLANWTEKEVWQYIQAHNIPYHSLYDQGYTSIGCAPCTRSIRPGEDHRAGRWWWEEETVKECGLHYHMKTDRNNHNRHNRNVSHGNQTMSDER